MTRREKLHRAIERGTKVVTHYIHEKNALSTTYHGRRFHLYLKHADTSPSNNLTRTFIFFPTGFWHSTLIQNWNKTSNLMLKLHFLFRSWLSNRKWFAGQFLPFKSNHIQENPFFRTKQNVIESNKKWAIVTFSFV